MANATTEVVRRFDLVLPSVVHKPHKGFHFPNGAKAVVIEDPACQLAGAAVTMRVGSNQDPEKLPGLAHFCEHMLFMGTAKYPREDAFDAFVSRHGGHTNAWTESQGTTYYFTVSDESFLEALDQFLEFFVAPSFNQSAITREMEAVHSEDEKNHNIDYWRLDEVMRSIADPRHPYSRYGNGNLTTLRDVPRELGIDVRQELLKYYETHYVADAVSITLYSRRSAEDVLPILEHQLSRMRQRPHPPSMDPPANSFVPTSHAERSAPFDPSAIRQWYNIQTKKQTRSVRIHFPYPDPVSRRHSMASGYASHVLGHECDVSLLGALKKRGWATGIVAGASQHRDDDDGVFYIDVHLTCDGFKNVLVVLEWVFKAIDLIRNGHCVDDKTASCTPSAGELSSSAVDETTFTQMRAEDRLTFEMTELGRPEMHCATLSSLLHTAHRLEDAWLEGFAPTEEDKAASMELLRSKFVPDRCVIFLLWNGFPVVDPTTTSGAAPPEVDDEVDVEEDPHESDEEHEDAEDLTQRPAATNNEELYASLPEFARFPCTTATTFHKAMYGSCHIPEKVLASWRLQRAFVEDGLGFPPKNRFLATNFTIFNHSTAAATEDDAQQQHPTNRRGMEHELPDMFESDYGRLFVMTRCGQYLRVPKTAVVVEFVSPVPYATPRHRFLTRVMVHMLKHRLTEVSYMGELSSITNDVVASPGGVGISVEGPTHHLALFVQEVVAVSVDPEALYGTEALFETYRELSLRDLNSVASQQPYQLCSDRLQRLFVQQHYTFDDILQALDTKAPLYEEYTSFVDSYVAQLRFDVVVTGNVASAADARRDFLESITNVLRKSQRVDHRRNGSSSAADVLTTTTTVAALTSAPFSQDKCRTLPYLTSLLLPVSVQPPALVVDEGFLPPRRWRVPRAIIVQELCAFNESDANCSVVWEIQMGRESPALRVQTDCVAKMISSLFFNALRTREALGYIVAVQAARTHGVCALKFVAQSAKPGVDAWYLLSRMIAFVDAIQQCWASTICTQASLSDITKSLVRARQEPLKAVRDSAVEMAVNLRHPSGFQRRLREIEAINSGTVVTSEALTALFDECISNASDARRSAAVMIQPVSHAEAVNRRRLLVGAVTSDAPPAPLAPPGVSQFRRVIATGEGASSELLLWSLPAALPTSESEQQSATNTDQEGGIEEEANPSEPNIPLPSFHRCQGGGDGSGGANMSSGVEFVVPIVYGADPSRSGLAEAVAVAVGGEWVSVC